LDTLWKRAYIPYYCGDNSTTNNINIYKE